MSSSIRSFLAACFASGSADRPAIAVRRGGNNRPAKQPKEMDTDAAPAAPAAGFREIERLARDYAGAREGLAGQVAAYHEQMRALQGRFVPGIRAAAGVAAGAQANLIAAIAAHPELFEKPRTLTLHGIKLGFQKGKGRIDWDDDEKVLAAIGRNYPADVAESLIITTRLPSKDALAQRPAAELRRLGVTVTDATDHVVVKAADTDVDKLVARVLKDGIGEDAASEAKAA